MIDQGTDPRPTSRVLSGDEWEQSQYSPAGLSGDPTKPTGKLRRVLTGDEWEQAQRTPVKELRIRTLPTLPAQRDATATGMDQRTKGKKIGGVAGAVLRQVVDPMLENPFTTIGTTAALAMPIVGPTLGALMAGQMVYHVAQYGWQKAAELSLSPEDRARAEADPERISGEAAAVQAAMLGLGPLIHVGVRGYRGLDVSGGMMEAGAAGVKELRPPEFSRGALDRSEYGARRLAEDQADLKATPLSSMLLDDKPKSVEFDIGRRPQREALAPSVADYEARRLAEDQADLSAARAADADRVAKGPRRRAKGPGPFFESPQGAETLGAVAARHGLPSDANPYHPSTSLAEDWSAGHAAATESFRNMSETGFASIPGDEPSSVLLPTEGAGRAGSTVDAVARAKELVGADRLRELADAEWERRGAPDTPESRMAAMEQVARDVASSHATEPLPAYPEGFAMGGEGRIPGASEVPRRARGADVPEGATPETAALANALKPSRFRGHSTDELADAALDAQTALEEAQAAQEHARTGVLTSERAQADMENRGVSYSDESEGTSVTADRQVAAAKTRLAQIEREFTLRGVAGDALAEIMQAAKEARLEREGMSNEQALARATEDFFGSGPGEDPRRPAVLPVEGTGAVRQRGLAASVVRKAVANKLDLGLSDVPEYRQISMADQSARAVALLEQDPALARRVALGEVPAPDGLLPESVFVAVENAAIEAGDVATIRDLATRSDLTAQATQMGQRIRALGERDPESPVAAIKEVITVRMGGAKNVPRATEETIAAIRAQLAKSSISREAWASFVDSLRC